MNDKDDHIHPSDVRYLSSAPINSDGTLSRTNSETHLLSDTLETLTERAIEESDQHGETFYIYECRLIRKVIPGKARVITIKNRCRL